MIKELLLPLKNEMVRASMREIEPKTQTRRTKGLDKINMRPDDWALEGLEPEVDKAGNYIENGRMVAEFYNATSQISLSIRCPFGAPGFHLWVREEWKTGDWLDDAKPSQLLLRHPNPPIKYLSDGRETGNFSDRTVLGRYRPPMFMPRWASRLTLEITDIRVERLNDICEEDAEAEGIERNVGNEPWQPEDGWLKYPYERYMEDFPAFTPRESFQTLWESISGEGSWALNPWVWAITFKRVPA